MDENDIRLIVIEKTEELHEHRSNRSFWRSAIATLIIVPIAYFGLQSMAKDAADNAAKEALKNQQAAWASVFSSITDEATRSAIDAESASSEIERALKIAKKAQNEAEESSKSLQAASSNISRTLGFQNKNEVIKALLETSEVKTVISESKTQNFELFIKREKRFNGQYNPGDSSCIMACPKGWVMKESWHENPSNAHDCEGGKFLCVEMAVREIK